MCIGCHGIGGYKTAFPEVYSVPKLGGQHAAYSVKALQAYKSGARKNAIMAPQMANLSKRRAVRNKRHWHDVLLPRYFVLFILRSLPDAGPANS